MERFMSRSVCDVAYVLLLMVLISVGVFRISSTYNVFWQTWDEPFHIAAGMEWLVEGQYTYEHFHPPLARVMVALGPYLSGVGDFDLPPGTPWAKGNALLHAGGAYERTLTLARTGILPFFVLASIVVALWAKHVGGKLPSLIAVLLFTSLPPILAHAGLATLDMACAALVIAALFNFTLWLNKPSFWCSVGLGITVGLAVLSKMTALGFLVISGSLVAAAYVLYRVRRKPEEIRETDPRMKARITGGALALLVCALTIWAGYRFSVASLAETVDEDIAAYAYGAIDSLLGTGGALHDMAIWLLQTSIPAPEFFAGIFRALHRASNGHLQLFLGEIRTHGWWYYYPAILMIKTPLPTLILGFVGLVVILRMLALKSQNWFLPLAPFLVLIAIMAVGMMSSVNNGIRAILTVYGPLTVIAGYGAEKLLIVQHKRLRILGIFIVVTLTLWQAVSSFRAHPDYLAYFSPLAGKDPEQVVVGSDLDWGQDLKRLSIELRNYEIDTIKMNVSGVADIDKFDFPPSEPLRPYARETGWIAISTYRLTFGTREPPYDQYSWLREYEPIKKVGKTIRLYYIDEKFDVTK